MIAKTVKYSEFLGNQINEALTLHGFEIEYNRCSVEEPGRVFLVYNATEFVLIEVEGGPKRLFLYPNDLDPENPVSVETVAKKLADRILTGDPPVKDLEPISYYGCYVATLQEALDTALCWLNTPVKDWPKEYNKPHPFFS